MRLTDTPISSVTDAKVRFVMCCCPPQIWLGKLLWVVVISIFDIYMFQLQSNLEQSQLGMICQFDRNKM